MASVEGRTVREFPADQSVWSVIDDWAQRVGYELKGSGEWGRLYQKGSGLWTLPRMLQATPTATGVRLEVWVRASNFNRIFALFIVPSESVLDSGGKVAIVPRNKGREEVNLLLQSLGQPLIQ
jgi:hypothetical protein